MKQKNVNGHLQRLQESIGEISRKSKETVHHIIDSSNRQFEVALSTNEKYLEHFEKQVLNRNLTDTSIISELKRLYGNSFELSEGAIDTIIDIQSSQLQSTMNFTLKIAETMKDLEFPDNDKWEEIFATLEKNFQETSSGIIENTRKMTDIYNKHINLAVNFNEKFSKNINSQLQVLNTLQSRNMDMFNDWASHWWKSTSKEEVAL